MVFSFCFIFVTFSADCYMEVVTKVENRNQAKLQLSPPLKAERQL